MLLSYNTLTGTEVYEVSSVAHTRTFNDMCDGYAYVRRVLDPIVDKIHWFKLEDCVLQVIHRRRVS